MSEKLLQEINRLSVEERLKLVEDIWDGIATGGELPALSEVQRTELDQRLEEHEQNPEAVVPWEQARAELWKLVNAKPNSQ